MKVYCWHWQWKIIKSRPISTEGKWQKIVLNLKNERMKSTLKQSFRICYIYAMLEKHDTDYFTRKMDKYKYYQVLFKKIIAAFPAKIKKLQEELQHFWNSN